MASTSTLSLLHSPPQLLRCSTTIVNCLPSPTLHRRNLSLVLLLSAAPSISIFSCTSPSKAEDIPLFGLRKKLKKVEEDVVEIVKEGEEVVGEVVKEGEEAVVKEIQTVEGEVAGSGLGLAIAGDLVQAGAVVGAEAVGVLVGVSVVNGILGVEGK